MLASPTTTYRTQPGHNQADTCATGAHFAHKHKILRKTHLSTVPQAHTQRPTVAIPIAPLVLTRLPLTLVYASPS